MKKLIPAIFGVLLLSGCASTFLQSNEAPVAIYSLRPMNEVQTLDAGKQGVAKVLEVQRPALPPGFDTARIGMYLENGRRLDYYASAKWPTSLDETLQEFTAQNARKTFPGLIVITPGSGVDAQYLLQTKVNDFQPVYAMGPQAAPLLVASISFTLLSLPEENIVTSFTVEQQVQAQANNLGVITAGLETLLQSVERKAFETIAPKIK
ncbi:MAG: hypothetical protein DI586_02370 [Micavibrio aeruginosavorus]|uniref:ABC-type transport auxiliary lipoprotein component domain-containing protein n=1 Tax=Micavibrio aeruginosavorus TaxID=349221 RepID=A0A2W5HF98_9BACT|nr:MAG: hypothetical protein DI586_02370 [Micavibrio aeruginosavorus]